MKEVTEGYPGERSKGEGHTLKKIYPHNISSSQLVDEDKLSCFRALFRRFLQSLNLVNKEVPSCLKS